jgi:ubiquinone/menaquinone biosynthesis C-methylase UbiE
MSHSRHHQSGHHENVPKPGHHTHESTHEHAHAHAHDRGWTGFLRYASMLPRMWKSVVSSAVVAQINPRQGETVLEIGSGMGAAAFVAARSNAAVIAIDPTPYMRRVMRLRRFAHVGSRRISILDGAAEAIPVAAESVDALWAVNTMHHWTDLDRAFAEIHRVLRPGGRLLLVDEDFENPAHPDSEKFQQKRAKHAHSFTSIDPINLTEKLRRLGFNTSEGLQESIAGRPAKVVRGIKS